MKLAHLLVALCFLPSLAMAEMTLTPLWTLKTDLSNPESLVYHPSTNALYVTNVNGHPMEADNNGYISKISDEGEVIEAKWLVGLDGPKGIAVRNDRLYVADLDDLVVIDINKAKIITRHHAPKSKFLNDVTIDQAGNVYVSDMMTNEIYRLSGGRFEVWLADPALESPNGLLIEGNQLVVGSWGVMTDGFATEVEGHLKTIDLDSRKIKSLGNGTPVGNLDGVEADSTGHYFVTDWMDGRLLRISPSGHAETLLEFEQGSADHTVMPEKDLVVIPMMNTHEISAYHLSR
jgi:sugar lactone lactonase YvrE